MGYNLCYYSELGISLGSCCHDFNTDSADVACLPDISGSTKDRQTNFVNRENIYPHAYLDSVCKLKSPLVIPVVGPLPRYQQILNFTLDNQCNLFLHRTMLVFAMQIWNVSMECVLTKVLQFATVQEQSAGMVPAHSMLMVSLAAIRYGI